MSETNSINNELNTEEIKVDSVSTEDIKIDPVSTESLSFDLSMADDIDAKRKKRRLFRTIAIILVLAVAIAGFIFLSLQRSMEPTIVNTVEARTDSIVQRLSTSGFVESENSQIIYAEVEAPIEKVCITEGSSVKKGDTLVVYDTTKLESTRNKAVADEDIKELQRDTFTQKSNTEAAAYSDADNNLAVLDAQIATLQTEIDDLYAQSTANTYWKESDGAWLGDQIEKLEAEKENASDKRKSEIEEEIDDLKVRQRTHSNVQIEEYIRQKQETLSTLKENRSTYESKKDSSKAGIATSSEKEEYQREVDLATYSREEAESELAKAQSGVVAPFDGIISDVKASTGLYTGYGTELFTLRDNKKVKTTIAISRFELEYIKEGQSAEITVAGHSYTGSVSHIDKAASMNEKGVSVINAAIHIDNPDEFIYLGVDAKVKVNVGSAENALVVPVEAVNMDAEGYYCYVLDDDVVIRKNVTTGLSSETMVEILSGIKEGDVIINDSSVTVEEGMHAVSADEFDEGPREE